MPFFPGATDTDPVNGMIFVLGHVKTIGKVGKDFLFNIGRFLRNP